MDPLNFPLPKKMRNHEFSLSWHFSKSTTKKIWDKLQRRETFTKGQLPPYKVEFESGHNVGKMEAGELNIHHGPFLSAHGIIGEINDSYRDLKYSYGSYVLSFRIVRPVRLEFFKKNNSIKLKFTCQVHHLFYFIWHVLSEIFWRQFGLSLKIYAFFK